MTAPLAPLEFDSYFRALWAHDPFPWQSRLANRIAEEGVWPSMLDLPTASGKTAVIDIAIFRLALEADRLTQRRAPVRILYVVDRRLVVDSAYERAKHIAKMLRVATSGDESSTLFRVASRLLYLAGPGEDAPLRVARLRGGMPKEGDWARTPCQPTVVASTVDQIGSRLLFRGYGVSDRMKPVHAGLIGSDALILLDEVHLSQPFRETLESVARYRQPCQAASGAQTSPSPFAVVSMSATPGQQGGDGVFDLAETERTGGPLAERLAASKRTRLIKSEAPRDDQAGLAAEFARHTRDLAKMSRAIVTAVVVNRVGLARAICDALLMPPDGEAKPPFDVSLLIGRSRPLDRDDLLKDLLPRTRAQNRQDGEPVVVVATQCVEAGADLDFDALITQIAPLDCLRQRFGRLDRLGRRGSTEAIIVAAKDEVGSRAEDALYGGACRETWEWLSANAIREGQGKSKREFVDFGADALAGLLAAAPPTDPAALLAPRGQAPLLLPAYLDLWAQTSPPPAVDPEPALFLHGEPDARSDVQIVWRADLTDAALSEKGRDEEALSIVAAIPPSTLEAVSVPIGVARRWLRRQADAGVALFDVEGQSDEENDQQRPGRPGRRALCWRGGDDAGIVAPSDIRPGDILVVPATYGGCDRFGWHPRCETPVSDWAEQAHLASHGKLVLRLDELLLRQDLGDGEEPATAAVIWRQVADVIEEHADAPHDLISALLATAGIPRRWHAWLSKLDDFGPRLDVRAHDGAVLIGRRTVDKATSAGLLSGDVETPAEAVTEDDDSSLHTGVEVALAKHANGVETLARSFAQRSGLTPDRVDDVALAAFLHDAGKAEARFQAYLHRGDEIAALSAPCPLAKSGDPYRGRVAEEAARQRARLPRGARHEAASVRFAESHPRLLGAHDRDLVVYLIGTHHGWGRPFFPPTAYPEPGTVIAADLGDGLHTVTVAEPPLARLDSGWIDQAERLKQRYGLWELARFEAILRLADHRRSEAEQREGR